MTLDRFDIFVDFDGFLTIERHPDGCYVPAEQAPANVQRVSVKLWNAGEATANLSFDEDDDGEWVSFEDIKRAALRDQVNNPYPFTSPGVQI